MDFPGGRVPFTSALAFAGGPDVRAAPMACYRTIDSAGGDVPDASVPHPLGQHSIAYPLRSGPIFAAGVTASWTTATPYGRIRLAPACLHATSVAKA